MAGKRKPSGHATQMELNLIPAENERLQAEIHRLQMENTRLLSELAQLRRLLQAQASMPLAEGVATPAMDQEVVEKLYSEPCISHVNVTKQSAIQEKIALFRSFFRGREDVYIRREKRDISGPVNIWARRMEKRFGARICRLLMMS